LNVGFAGRGDLKSVDIGDGGGLVDLNEASDMQVFCDSDVNRLFRVGLLWVRENERNLLVEAPEQAPPGLIQ
jgi:hypothetical protein